MKPVDEKRLAEIVERANKASEGPWYPHATDDDLFMNARYVSTESGDLYHDGARGMAEGECDDNVVVAITLLQSPRLAGIDDAKWDENTAFIAHAREDVPDLAEALRQAWDENTRLREAAAVLKLPLASGNDEEEEP